MALHWQHWGWMGGFQWHHETQGHCNPATGGQFADEDRAGGQSCGKPHHRLAQWLGENKTSCCKKNLKKTCFLHCSACWCTTDVFLLIFLMLALCSKRVTCVQRRPFNLSQSMRVTLAVWRMKERNALVPKKLWSSLILGCSVVVKSGCRYLHSAFG